MRTYILYALWGIVIVSVLMLALTRQTQDREHEPIDGIAAILADVPNQTDSDQRKQATLLAACLSIADLLQTEAITDTDEVAAAFHIETANLRTREPWLSIQQRLEMLLRKAKNVHEQEMLLRQIVTEPQS